MPTIAENLQTLVGLKTDIKASLQSQGKEVSDSLSTYAGLIDSLENPDEVTYCVTVDGVNKAYAQLYGEKKVELTATENDIRLGTSAITNTGYTEGIKDIPGYIVRYGKKAVDAGTEAVIPWEPGYKTLLVTLAPFNSSIDNSTAVNYTSVDSGIYEVNSTIKISDISIDTDNEQINLGITQDVMSILRYFIVREEV